MQRSGLFPVLRRVGVPFGVAAALAGCSSSGTADSSPSWSDPQAPPLSNTSTSAPATEPAATLAPSAVPTVPGHLPMVSPSALPDVAPPTKVTVVADQQAQRLGIDAKLYKTLRAFGNTERDGSWDWATLSALVAYQSGFQADAHYRDGAGVERFGLAAFDQSTWLADGVDGNCDGTTTVMNATDAIATLAQVLQTTSAKYRTGTLDTDEQNLVARTGVLPDGVSALEVVTLARDFRQAIGTPRNEMTFTVPEGFPTPTLQTGGVCLD